MPKNTKAAPRAASMKRCQKPLGPPISYLPLGYVVATLLEFSNQLCLGYHSASILQVTFLYDFPIVRSCYIDAQTTLVFWRRIAMERRKIALLMPELVPGPLWGRSAHKMLGNKAVWRMRIRGDTLAEANNRCSVCKSSEGRMTCHEKWGYDDRQFVATLLGFE